MQHAGLKVCMLVSVKYNGYRSADRLLQQTAQSEPELPLASLARHLRIWSWIHAFIVFTITGTTIITNSKSSVGWPSNKESRAAAPVVRLPAPLMTTTPQQM
jgi:hypothetical protein